MCCAKLKSLLDSAGENGMALLPFIHKGTIYFLVQSRSEIKGKRLTVMEMVISYCPFCGKKLSQLSMSDLNIYIKKSVNLVEFMKMPK